jgi:hypothetical protein
MGKDRSLVRASDIGAWTYCHRAWWLAQVKQVAHQQPEVLVAGAAAHRRHGRQVALAHRAELAGRWLAITGAVVVALAVLLYLLE